ncbi:MAG: hypothetical protein HYZ15_04605 [Sphingobacteriales bacterium]|nr:hypothetical protein [Sphingobacteriales bacterium]
MEFKKIETFIFHSNLIVYKSAESSSFPYRQKTTSQVAMSATGKMFNCCTIASCSLPPESAGVEPKVCFNSRAAKDSGWLLPEKSQYFIGEKS